MPMSQKGVIPPYLLLVLAVLGVTVYLLTSISAPFKDKLFSIINPKPASRAEGDVFPCARPNQLQIQLENPYYTCQADSNGCVKTPYVRYLYTTDVDGDGVADPQNPYDQPWCDNNCADPIKSCGGGGGGGGGGSCTEASACTNCILTTRTDILPAFQSWGWDISCGNWNNIANEWCNIDPSGCNGIKTTTCASPCGYSPPPPPSCGTPQFQYNQCTGCNESEPVYRDSCGNWSTGPKQTDSSCGDTTWCAGPTPTPVSDPCPGQHDITGVCNAGCCSNNGQCPSGEKCNLSNGYCQSGKSCNSRGGSDPAPTPTPTPVPPSCLTQTCTYHTPDSSCASGLKVCSGSGTTGENQPGCIFTEGCSSCSCYNPEPAPAPAEKKETCNGKYSMSLLNSSPLKSNFGDPDCNYDKYGLYDYLKANDFNNADKWMAIAFCESTFVPNAYNKFSVGGGAYGLFQMAGQGSKVVNGIYDKGDVVWKQQSYNAIMYNKLFNAGNFGYWECRNATYWP